MGMIYCDGESGDLVVHMKPMFYLPRKNKTRVSMERNWLYTRETLTEEESEEEGFLSFRNNIVGGDMDDETDAQIPYLLRNRYINLVS